MIKLFSCGLLAILFLESKSCDQKMESSFPECIQQMISTYQSKPVQNPPAAIYQYDYNNQKCYYVIAPCCDQMNTVYDANCNVLCHPDGGFSGKGDNKCTDFNAAKTNEVLIWKDDRKE